MFLNVFFALQCKLSKIMQKVSQTEYQFFKCTPLRITLHFPSILIFPINSDGKKPTKKNTFFKSSQEESPSILFTLSPKTSSQVCTKTEVSFLIW